MECIGSVNVNFDIWEITGKTRRIVLQPIVISFKNEKFPLMKVKKKCWAKFYSWWRDGLVAIWPDTDGKDKEKRGSLSYKFINITLRDHLAGASFINIF